MFKNAKDLKDTYRREFVVEGTSGATAARTMLSQVMGRLQKLDLSPDTLGTVELVVAEAINNVVEHAYPDRAGPITMTVALKSEVLSFQITDQGLGMPDGKAPDGTAQSVNVDLMDMPEGGFGWFLIRSQASDVVYQRAAWENHLSFNIKCE